MPTPSINSNNVITGTNVKITNGAPTKADVMCKAMCMGEGFLQVLYMLRVAGILDNANNNFPC